MAYVSIVVSLIMAGVSGSAVADASSVSAVLHPIMKDRGYDDEFAVNILRILLRNFVGITWFWIPGFSRLVFIGIKGLFHPTGNVGYSGS